MVTKNAWKHKSNPAVYEQNPKFRYCAILHCTECAAALTFYRDTLGFEITFQGPTNDDIYFGIVQRGGAMIILKEVGIEPVPNYTRDIKKGIAGGMPISMFPIQML